MKAKADTPFVPLNIAVLTVSDTRTFDTDTSGQLFVDRLTAAGHQLAARVLLKDDLYKIRAQVATWIADDQVQVVLITGGTGFTGRDSTPEAVACLLDKQVEGFGELFRQISVADIGTSTVQSRALAAWPMAPWCAACRVRPMPCAPAGTASSPNSSTPAIARATSSLT
jgi:molybdenum cofactor biosynthesis protein B